MYECNKLKHKRKMEGRKGGKEEDYKPDGEVTDMAVSSRERLSSRSSMA